MLGDPEAIIASAVCGQGRADSVGSPHRIPLLRPAAAPPQHQSATSTASPNLAQKMVPSVGYPVLRPPLRGAHLE